MGFDLDITIPAITVFLQGILSVLSPCVLPIIPLYMGYLAGGTMDVNEDGSKNFSQKKVILHTFFFIIGVSFAFFSLGIGFSAAGKFLNQYQVLFSRIGGILVILLGLIQLGVFDKPFQGREFKLPIKINAVKMNPMTAFLMGFVFSFAWTPCVGPALSTVLIMVSSAQSMTTGLVLMGIYTVGFTLPFVLMGLFTTQCLNILKKHQALLVRTVKLGGALMVLMGIMMFTGVMNSITGYLSTFDGVLPSEQVEMNDGQSSNNEAHEPNKTGTTNGQNTESTTQKETGKEDTQGEQTNTTSEKEEIAAIDFELQDQFGNTHKLSDYKGKVVFLNFWATWCPPCKKEMPDIQKLYEAYGLNEEEVIILGVASPKSEDNPYTQEQTTEEVIAFLEENNYTYPTVLDTTGTLERAYGISAYPTTFMIDVDGNVFGYLPGMMTYDIMESIIEQTQNQ